MKELVQVVAVYKHVIVSLQQVNGVSAPVGNPLQGHDVFVSQVPIGVMKTSLDYVTVIFDFLVKLYCLFSRVGFTDHENLQNPEDG